MGQGEVTPLPKHISINNHQHIKQLSYNSYQHYQNQYIYYLKQMSCNHQHIINLEHVLTSNSSTFCSTIYHITLIYQYSYLTLQQDITNRRKEKKVFKQIDIWNILNACIKGMAFLQKTSAIHSALSPKNITICSNSIIKLQPFPINADLIDECPFSRLVMTILQCIKLSSPTNDNLKQQVLETLEGMGYSDKMKEILLAMLNKPIKFNDLLSMLIEEHIEQQSNILPINQSSQYHSITTQYNQIYVQPKYHGQPINSVRHQNSQQSTHKDRSLIISIINQLLIDSSSIKQASDQQSIQSQVQYQIRNTKAQGTTQIFNNILHNTSNITIKHTTSNITIQNTHKNIQKQIENSIEKISSSKQSMEYSKQTYTKGMYQGKKLNNMRHGQGTFFYSQGGKYVGQWYQNKMHGFGILYYPNAQKAYEGQWQMDQVSGNGTLYNFDIREIIGSFNYKNWNNFDNYWIKYVGEFKCNNKHGFGKLLLVNGQYFEGNFNMDEVDGEGWFVKRDGSRVKGIWKNNKMVRVL